MDAFHVHTWRCRHGSDENEIEYIKKCCELGTKRIFFTDHCPFPVNPFRSRMTMVELSDYVGTLKTLQKLYKGKIDIVIGVEAEYLPTFDAYYAYLKNEYRAFFRMKRRKNFRILSQNEVLIRYYIMKGSPQEKSDQSRSA